MISVARYGGHKAGADQKDLPPGAVTVGPAVKVPMDGYGFREVGPGNHGRRHGRSRQQDFKDEYLARHFLFAPFLLPSPIRSMAQAIRSWTTVVFSAYQIGDGN